MKKMEGVNGFFYEFVFNFHEGLARVKRNGGLAGFIDKTGKEVIPMQYSIASDFANGFARVRDTEGRNFYIDQLGREFREK